MAKPTPPRVVKRPTPDLWRADEPMTLQEFIAVFYPLGPITVTSLRTEIAKGRLPVARVAGKYFVTRAAVMALLAPVTRSPAESEMAARAEAARNAIVARRQDRTIKK